MEQMKYETMNMVDYDIINNLVDEMMNAYPEVMGAKKYARDAIKHKTIDKALAEARLAMSSDELSHGETIITGINRMMDKLKAQKHPCYDVVQFFWTRIHDDLTNQIAKVRALHEQYRKIS